MATVQSLTPDQLLAHLPGFCELLEACVADGASIGFLWPMAEGEAEAYWRSLLPGIESGETILLLATEPSGGSDFSLTGVGLGQRKVIGSGQLVLATKANGVHRAEVSKLMVLTEARSQGIGRAIMLALEEEARAHKRTTLVLDTCQDGGAEPLYRSLGWTEVGPVPQFAAWPDGSLGATVFYYKLLT